MEDFREKTMWTGRECSSLVVLGGVVYAVTHGKQPAVATVQAGRGDRHVPGPRRAPRTDRLPSVPRLGTGIFSTKIWVVPLA